MYSGGLRCSMESGNQLLLDSSSSSVDLLGNQTPRVIGYSVEVANKLWVGSATNVEANIGGPNNATARHVPLQTPLPYGGVRGATSG